MDPIATAKQGILRGAHEARAVRRAQRYLLESRRLARQEREALVALGEAALDGEPPTVLRERVRSVRAQRELARGFHQREPWTTRFVIDGIAYGGAFEPPESLRTDFAASFPGMRSILELGSLEGGHTLGLAALPGVERIVAIEGRRESAERARFVQAARGIDRVELVVANLEDADLTHYGRFDAVFCVGLLYHLPRPWELLHRLAEVTDRLFVWTQCAETAVTGEEAGGYAGRRYREWGRWEPLSGLSQSSFWPTREDLKRMLGDAGFVHTRQLHETMVPRRGPAVTLAATTDAVSPAAD